MLRAFNAREGLTREQDTLPKRLFEPLVGGPSDGKAVDRETFDAALEMYYEQVGWDPVTGWGRPVWKGMLQHFGEDSLTVPYYKK